MKKFLMLGVSLLLCSVLISCGDSQPEAKKEEIKQEAKKENIFEQIGYCKTAERDRTFIIYTDSTDKEDMIKEGQKKSWTSPRRTYVVFINSKDGEKIQDNTMYYEDWDKGIMLDGMISDETVVLGTYSVSPNGNEWWHEGAPMSTAEPLGTKREM